LLVLGSILYYIMAYEYFFESIIKKIIILLRHV
jgi:hypothetical protein